MPEIRELLTEEHISQIKKGISKALILHLRGKVNPYLI